MKIEVVKKMLGGMMYRASINQKGVKCSIITGCRKKAITMCWHEYMIALRG